jgi:class 3 adenylate cyclase
MFSDLVGSTALSTRMDPEDLREVISAYQKCVAETVQRFGGFVAKYMGDGVLVYSQRYIQHTVRYTELLPTPFKDFLAEMSVSGTVVHEAKQKMMREGIAVPVLG